MAKNNSNGSGAGTSTPPTIHLILQGKGGIGKSVVASWLAEFLMGRGQPVCWGSIRRWLPKSWIWSIRTALS